MIPETFIHELLNRIDVVDVVDKRVQLKKAGANYVACCPFHKEKTPSFSVSPSKQFYHCFGCGAHGSAISFLIEHDGLTFVEAVNDLASSVGLKVPNDNTQKKTNTSETQSLEEILNKANLFYQKKLRDSKEAIEYLKKRGLTGQVAKAFSIGFAPEGWSNLSDQFSSKDEEILIKAGLAQKNQQNKLYDRFRNRIMFPIINEKGVVIGFGGRVINPEDTPKYYNSPETPLFQKSYELYGLVLARKSIRENHSVLVVEGYMDVVALAQHGVRNAVATLGTATTSFHIKKLMRYTQEIIFCFDGDHAGKEAAWRAMQNAIEALTDNLVLKFLFLPEGHDPDSFIRENSKEAFDALIKDAYPLSEYLIRYLSQNNKLSSQEDKVKFLNEIEPIINKIDAPKLNLFLKKKISNLLGLDESDMNAIFKPKTISAPLKPKIDTKFSLSLKRKFCLMMLLDIEAVRQDDVTFFNGNDNDDLLGQAIIKLVNELEKKTYANLMYALELKFDESFVKDINRQLSRFDMNLNYKDELDAMRQSLTKKMNTSENLSRLNLLQKKSPSSLTEDEKAFLRGMKKL